MVTAKKAAKPVEEAVAKRITAKAADAAAPSAKRVAPKAKSPAVAPTKAIPAAKASADSPTKTAVRKKPAAPAVPSLSAAQRAHYVEVAAFYIAERRGFAGANPADDWIAAEAEIDRLVATGHFAH
jgi:hypothetical protein